MVVPIVHFFKDVSLVLLELSKRVRLDLLDFVPLTLEFGVQFVNKVSLLLQTFLLLCEDGLFDPCTFFSQILKDLTFFLDTSVLLSFQIDKVLVHLRVNRSQLVIQALNAVASRPSGEMRAPNMSSET